MPRMEILEAGTGHGSLTLHLARAIHAANAGIPSTAGYPKSPRGIWKYARALAVGSISRLLAMRTPASCVDKCQEAIPRAIVHTVDVSSKCSEHAAKLVRGFRRGMYSRNVQFHVANVSEWIEQQKHARGSKPFLSHVLLDLPASHSHVEAAVSALHVDGKLLVFNPSITQINSTLRCVKSKRLPLQLEKVIEVGPAMTGGRIWDVRFVVPRALAKTAEENILCATQTKTEQTVGDGGQASRLDDDKEEEPLDQICRPKAGERVSGGGFVALWSKNRTRQLA
ncbi:MAG: hypothetical protein Q9169_001531 [Polycauliona sp. 2 TL-2023]